MPGGFLGRLLGRSNPLSAEVGEALAELARLAETRPSIAAPAAMLREVLPALFADPSDEKTPPITAESAQAKLTGGMPLLRGESLSLDTGAFQRRWRAVCTAVQRHQNPEGGKAVAEALERRRLGPAEMVTAVLAGHPEVIHQRADELGLEAPLTTAVLGLVLFPALARINGVLAPVRDGKAWHHGHCPTCGSWPLLGEFRGLEQTRFLRCGLCASEWEFPRLLCPYCGERDHRQLGYFGVEGEESRWRAAVCESCRGYVKMVSSLAALSAPALLVANVATLHLDLAAADRGYMAPPVLAEPAA